jgi:hypothetical protein
MNNTINEKFWDLYIEMYPDSAWMSSTDYQNGKRLQEFFQKSIQNTRAEMVYKIRQVLCSEDVLSLSVEKALEEMMEEVQRV